MQALIIQPILLQRSRFEVLHHDVAFKRKRTHKGSTFRLHLPLTLDGSAPPEPVAVPPHVPAPRAPAAEALPEVREDRPVGSGVQAASSRQSTAGAAARKCRFRIKIPPSTKAVNAFAFFRQYLSAAAKVFTAF